MATPEVITRQTLANSAAQNYEATYGGARASFRLSNGRMSHDVLRALRALGPTPSPDDVDATVGNSSWTTPERCSACGVAADAVVRVGMALDYESLTAYLCGRCLAEALLALRRHEAGEP